MKKLFFCLLLLVGQVAVAQTFPVNNLQVNGAATFNGAINTPALTSNGLLVGGSPASSVAPGASGFILQANGASPPTWVAPTSILPTFPLGISNGGTNATTATAATSNLQYLQGATGSVAESVTSKLQQTVDAADFGALCNGSHDDTAAIQAALNTGKRVHIATGTCVVSNALTISTLGQSLYGDGPNSTILLVQASFNLSALGVIVFATGEPGPQLDNFQISFVQPNTTSRASLTAYPPAVYAQSTPRFKIHRLKIVAAMVGIDMRLNCGGAVIDELDISAFTAAIWIDGSVDTVRLDKIHNWPFGLTTNLLTIFNSTGTIGLNSGRMDDLVVTDSLFFAGTAVNLYVGSEPSLGGSTFGSFVGCDFDTNSNIVNNGAGEIQFVACYFTVATTATGWYLQEQAGAQTFFTNCVFLANAIPLNAFDIVQGQVIVTGSYFSANALDFAYVIANTGTVVQLIGNHFQRTANVAYTQPTVYALTGSRLTASANRMDDKGTGAGIFIAVQSDNFHNITGNTAVGWSYSNPTYTTGIFANNN